MTSIFSWILVANGSPFDVLAHGRFMGIYADEVEAELRDSPQSAESGVEGSGRRSPNPSAPHTGMGKALQRDGGVQRGETLRSFFAR